jgi:hypothetical protein
MARLHIEIERLREAIDSLLLIKSQLTRREDENALVPTSQSTQRLLAVQAMYDTAEAEVEQQLRRLSDALRGGGQ